MPMARQRCLRTTDAADKGQTSPVHLFKLLKNKAINSDCIQILSVNLYSLVDTISASGW
jgi:hypothetical protein